MTMSNNDNARYKKSRELGDRKIQTQTHGYVPRFDPLLYVTAFTQKDFYYVHQGPSTKRPPPRNYKNTNKKYTTPTLTHLYTRGRHKVKYKVKKKLYLGDHKDHKYNLVISKNHK